MHTPDISAVRSFLDEPHESLVSAFKIFVDSSIATLSYPGDDDAARVQAKDIMALLGEGGWYDPIVQKDMRACVLIRETLAYVSPLADDIYGLQALGSIPIVMAGSDLLKKKWIDRMLKGKAMAAFAMTEPNAGSDIVSMETTAVIDGGDYILNGQKTFISNAGIADFYTVFAVTDPAKGHRGISCFVVAEDTPGLHFSGPQLLSTPHPLGDIVFDNCRVPASALIGEEGKGFHLGMATLDYLRATVGAAACGMAGRALHEALHYASERNQFGKSLSDFQLIQEKLARMATDLTAARLLVYRAAWEKDSGSERVTLESAMAKYFATEAAQRIIDDAVQIFGGRGVLAETTIDRLYRSIRPLRIYEGTTEIQHLVIAKELLKSLKD